jgi:hypothetical protein
MPSPESAVKLRRDILHALGWGKLRLAEVMPAWGDLLLWLYNCGSTTTIGDYLGFSSVTIKSDIRQAGGTIRGRGGPNAKGKSWRWER